MCKVPFEAIKPVIGPTTQDPDDDEEPLVGFPENVLDDTRHFRGLYFMEIEVEIGEFVAAGLLNLPHEVRARLMQIIDPAISTGSANRPATDTDPQTRTGP